MSTTNVTRYGRMAMWLHWAIGLALLGRIGFGVALDALRHARLADILVGKLPWGVAIS